MAAQHESTGDPGALTRQSTPEPVRFTVTVEMKGRWVPHFLGMLETMQYCGNVGTSRQVAIFADGDGDFRPKFDWQSDVEPAKGTETREGWLFDAG